MSPGINFKSPADVLKAHKALDVQVKKTVKPPLTRLPSFNTNAIILGFTVYSNEIEQWLNRLSKNAQKYFNSHEKILRAFLVLKPELRGEVRFGDAFCE